MSHCTKMAKASRSPYPATPPAESLVGDTLCALSPLSNIDKKLTPPALSVSNVTTSPKEEINTLDDTMSITSKGTMTRSDATENTEAKYMVSDDVGAKPDINPEVKPDVQGSPPKPNIQGSHCRAPNSKNVKESLNFAVKPMHANSKCSAKEESNDELWSSFSPNETALLTAVSLEKPTISEGQLDDGPPITANQPSMPTPNGKRPRTPSSEDKKGIIRHDMLQRTAHWPPTPYPARKLPP
ncbi:hypothetical protein SCP_1402750 [Sparassis crispa]|uniref:Uncharacterized protein n=1 Tax=Sparassis crispa TaxID=139825 RepID=A0A401H359_9APHY|nr:hypothetical protein SCP_1402750 [Sparassis crispa]GBE88867.1 hypothetical protein SCP_1402750 [Sparassis crispa]